MTGDCSLGGHPRAPGAVVDPARRATLDRRDLAPLWDELARRFADGPEPVAVTVRGLTEPQRQALADLLGADRLPGETTRLTVARLANVLGVDGAAGLRELTEALRGPLPDRAALRRARQSSRAELWDWLDRAMANVPLLAGRPDAAAGWAATMRSAGIPGGDVEAARSRFGSLLVALAALPADGISLAGFANDTFGSPHALDRGRWAAAAVLGAVAAATDREPPTDAESARALWEGVGVAPDPLSSTVLMFGLRPVGHDPVACYLRAMADAGEAAVLTLAQLRRWPLAPLASQVCYVVENPSLVAEVAGRRRTGPPVVCTSGRPAVAVVTALRQLGAAGATLRQHADFDPAGLAITAWLSARAGTLPWRMTAGDYRDAARPGGGPLHERVPPTPWDPTLAEAMSAAGVVAYEEDVRADLLDAMGY